MAVNPNFTNANANTSYFAIAGGVANSNFPNGLEVGLAHNVLDSASLYGNPAKITIWDSLLKGYPDYINAAGVYAIPSASNSQGVFNGQGITYLSTNATTTLALQNFVLVNLTGFSNGINGNGVFQLAGISSINSGARTINADKLLSSIQGYGWA